MSLGLNAYQGTEYVSPLFGLLTADVQFLRTAVKAANTAQCPCA